MFQLLQCQQQKRANVEKSIENVVYIQWWVRHLEVSNGSIWSQSCCVVTQEYVRFPARHYEFLLTHEIHFIKFITLLFSDLLINTVFSSLYLQKWIWTKSNQWHKHWYRNLYRQKLAKKRKIYDSRHEKKNSYSSHSYAHHYGHNHHHHHNHDYTSSTSSHRRGNRYGFTWRGLFEPTPFYKIFGTQNSTQSSNRI